MQQFVEIDYETVSTKVLGRLSDAKEMTLATSSDDFVTSRVISTACFDRKIIFLSLGSHQKATQIAANPNVALCYKNCGIDGRASLIGDASDVNFVPYIEKYISKTSTDFEMFVKMPGMKIFEIEISHMTSFGKDSNGFFTDRIDFVNKTAVREYYPSNQ